MGKVNRLMGELRPPSDKSLTHRAYMLGAIAEGESLVRSPLRGEDCERTLECLKSMGLRARRNGDTEVVLTPARAWSEPTGELYCGNSGTTMRLLSGLIASRPISATLSGDASLSKRPMGRIAKPLQLMGAEIVGDTPPLRIRGTEVKPLAYVSPVASAQIKSAILLAALRAKGRTSVEEPSLSRDHTERMLSSLGVPIEITIETDGRAFSALTGPAVPQPFEFTVPGDISSAAFFMVAAALIPESELILRQVGLNPTRSGILDVFAQCGINCRILKETIELGEPVADLSVSFAAEKQPFVIGGSLVPRLIDEIPVLSVLATQCEGTTIIKDAGELRVKETDRLKLTANHLTRMGADVEVFEDGLGITGPTTLTGVEVDACHDHRIAMAFAVAGLIAEGETTIKGAETIETSFPEFEETLRRLIV